MNGLNFMVTIIDRRLTGKFLQLYEASGLTVTILTAGQGTAANEILDYFGLEGSEKRLLFNVVTEEKWKSVKRALRTRLRIDVPGVGIAFIIPMSSIGGKKALGYLTDGQNYIKGEETSLKDTKYELIVVIANQGYSEKIMEAARMAQAGGGTVIHARGTGGQEAERFLGVTLVPEKDMLFIVSPTERRSDIMRSIMAHAGADTKAGAIVFSLPVTDTAGMRLMEELEADE